MKSFWIFIIFLLAYTLIIGQNSIITSLQISDKELWPRAIHIHPEGDIMILSQENNYNPNLSGIPFLGTAAFGVIMTKINQNGDSLWQKHFPIADGLVPGAGVLGITPARDFYIDHSGKWYLPYISNVSLQYCDTTYLVASNSDFPGLMVGSNRGSIYSDSLHSQPFCESYQVIGFFPNSDSNGITILSTQNESLRIMSLDSMNNIRSMNQSRMKPRFFKGLKDNANIRFITRKNDSLILLTTNLYGDSLNQKVIPFSFPNIFPFQIIKGQNQNFYILISYSIPPLGEKQGYAIIQVDSFGNKIQENLYPTWKINKMILLPNDELLVLRQLPYPQSDSSFIAVSKLDYAGNEIASKKYGKMGDIPVDFTINTNGEFVILASHFMGWGQGLPPASGLVIKDYLSNLLSVSIENFPENSFRLFPNPAVNYLYIEGLKKNQKYKINIFDAMGKKCMDLELTSSEKILLSELADGVYFLRIQSDRSKWQVSKFIIKR
ncbi:MAG: T9SS type A sorting domain-containing protein [Bacteroidetes bacterium]|nr:T9SS type A sorting domain-containing protein [Bacteroidota bacterium]